MRPVKISERNVMFTEPMDGGYDLNLGLILGGRFNFLIDTGLGSGSVAPVLEYLRVDRKPLIIVNTHYHWDHIWGNFIFRDSVIIAHAKCPGMINGDWSRAMREYGNLIDGEARKCLPNLLFDGDIYFPEDGVKIFYTPGHSADCVSVYDEAGRVLYAGDNIGDTDDEIVPYIDTDMETFRRTIEIYESYDFNVCVSGHNKPKGKDVIRRIDSLLKL